MTERKHSNLGETWTEDDDLLLVETVLRNVRDGYTIVTACEEMEDITAGRRTKGASKFRWHTRLKDQYETAYQLAREEGKKAKLERKRNHNKGKNFNEIVETVVQPALADEITLDNINHMLVMFRNQEASKYTDEIEKLERKNKRLTDELSEANRLLNDVRRDYNELVRALGALDNLGINVPMPKETTHSYRINPDGTIDRSK